mmetsp:Transcript_7432/g.19522  ORF Transcript_7432/g.19522 Transcript_7432/m.19522 type:complete len:263 (+) Transcript_7432:769-1557(+)
MGSGRLRRATWHASEGEAPGQRALGLGKVVDGTHEVLQLAGGLREEVEHPAHLPPADLGRAGLGGDGQVREARLARGRPREGLRRRACGDARLRREAREGRRHLCGSEPYEGVSKDHGELGREAEARRRVGAREGEGGARRQREGVLAVEGVVEHVVDVDEGRLELVSSRVHVRVVGVTPPLPAPIGGRPGGGELDDRGGGVDGGVDVYEAAEEGEEEGEGGVVLDGEGEDEGDGIFSGGALLGRRVLALADDAVGEGTEEA